jgi:hypothetical protein
MMRAAAVSSNPKRAGAGAPPGGRNRLMLDSHVEYLRDPRTPLN